MFSKACQYATIDEKVSKNLQFISIKYMKLDLHKCIIWIKKSRYGKHEWNKACLYLNICLQKLNILLEVR
jgi:hypothetical protein